ncbi:hypothetical protein DFH44_004884 [Clostridium beijerinckii]|jgi:hypothetical protein|nr:hypothetical protein [Clostridium beijerinckii]NRU77257.1 hypothetical protein [Clostridium beijerinckii]NRU84844.1 hypothetical protein [Clostridium beijerinckii]NRV26082.1 hypothetical protein [Clostridium beijerinckii]NRV87794.1 hypothetical protein [Clostridium beijerinckii]
MNVETRLLHKNSNGNIVANMFMSMIRCLVLGEIKNIRRI